MKSSEIQKMNSEQLRVEEQRLRLHLYDLRSQSVTEKLENPKQMIGTRKDVARVLTELRRRELEGGA